jgi:hypothetical protein
MPNQTGITFSKELMERVRLLKADLQHATPRGTITNTNVMEYLLALHDKYGADELAPKVEIAS